MMDHRVFYLIFLCTLLSITGPLPVNAGEPVASPQLNAQIQRVPTREHIITVQGEVSDSHFLSNLNPREVRPGRGDLVTWINESQVGVKIKIGKGTECKKVPVKALGWRLETGKCYETQDTLKPGNSATVQFQEVGSFTYEIEYVDKNRQEKGTIYVQSEGR